MIASVAEGLSWVYVACMMLVGIVLRIETARAYLPLMDPWRYKGLKGGRGSGKSHEFAKLLVEYFVVNPKLRAVCVREVQKSLEQSVKRLIEDKIEEFGLGHRFIVKQNSIETPEGGIIIFQGMQDHTAVSIKSLEGFDICWVEEAQSLSDTSLTLLRPTIRKEGSEIWFSWNPENEDDPVDKFLCGKDVPPDALVIKTTYRDNPWFTAVLRKEMEWDRRVDPEKYLHVWEGGYQKRGNKRIFKNWRVELFDTPADAQFFLGADWGFSVDPTTLVRCFEQRIDPATGREWPRKRLYIDRELFRIGVEIDFIPAFWDGLLCGCDNQIDGVFLTDKAPATCQKPDLHGWARHRPIIADSSRPDTISYLRRHKYSGIEAAKKGPNSIKEGVIFLQGYEIIIHERCTHTKDEFENYSFVVDKHSGLVTSVIEDKKNHIIDPVRYSLEQLRGALKIREALWG